MRWTNKLWGRYELSQLKFITPDFWFARELTPGALDDIGQSSSTIKGVFADPIMWSHPDEQI
ncbi:hypothetical protein [Aliivibrio fischeri]|uniref:hypothetical protein n=1 Tax=Aliivibrio fischeri TaxID=668 RepID=UPI0007C58F53|nr:hypothetical protein [Aliivibrio fischeri]